MSKETTYKDLWDAAAKRKERARKLAKQTPKPTYAEIGRQLGVTRQRAHQLVND